MLAGGAVLAEDQMPYGWSLDKDRRGRPRRDSAKGLVPVAVADDAPALAEAYGLHADGATYESICTKLVELEKDGGIRRRSGQRYNLAFADALGDRNRMYDAASHPADPQVRQQGSRPAGARRAAGSRAGHG